MAETEPNKPRILVVDDEQSILSAIKRVLRRAKFEVDTATNGVAALELLSERDYAVIVCDQRMPEMSGAEVLSQAHKTSPDTYRITLTGYTDLSSAQRSINDGKVQQFLTKPWNDDDLIGVIQIGVDAYNLIQENHRLTELARVHQEQLEQWNKELEQEVEKRTVVLKKQAVALEKLSQHLELSLRDTVELIVGILDAADANVAAHSRRVADLSKEISETLELDDKQKREVEYVALLHDVGMLAVLHTPPGRKPAKPKQPPVNMIGHALLSQVRGFEPVAEAVRCVPLWFDGSTDPELRHEAIPQAARIVAVANAFDRAAFSLSQPTKPRVEDGHKALAAGHGTQFDPRVIAALAVGELDLNSIDTHEVELSTKKLVPGMTLSRDVTNIQGVLMLKAGSELTTATIEKLREFAHSQILMRGIFVYCDNEPSVSSGGNGKDNSKDWNI